MMMMMIIIIIDGSYIAQIVPYRKLNALDTTFTRIYTYKYTLAIHDQSDG